MNANTFCVFRDALGVSIIQRAVGPQGKFGKIFLKMFRNESIYNILTYLRCFT